MLQKLNKKILFRTSVVASWILTFFIGSAADDAQPYAKSLDIPIGSIEKVYANDGGDCSGSSGADSYYVPASAGFDVEFRVPGSGQTGWGVDYSCGY